MACSGTALLILFIMFSKNLNYRDLPSSKFDIHFPIQKIRPV
jgi:hypothetical protein